MLLDKYYKLYFKGTIKGVYHDKQNMIEELIQNNNEVEIKTEYNELKQTEFNLIFEGKLKCDVGTEIKKALENICIYSYDRRPIAVFDMRKNNRGIYSKKKIPEILNGTYDDNYGTYKIDNYFDFSIAKIRHVDLYYDIKTIANYLEGKTQPEVSKDYTYKSNEYKNYLKNRRDDVPYNGEWKGLPFETDCLDALKKLTGVSNVSGKIIDHKSAVSTTKK